jgi:hypothetical protein
MSLKEERRDMWRLKEEGMPGLDEWSLKRKM